MLFVLLKVSTVSGQSCGFSFPAILPESVCDTTRYLWLSNPGDSSGIDGQFSGPGVVATLEGYLFSPVLAGITGPVTLKYHKKCGSESITITKTIEVMSCKACNCFAVPFPQIPDTFCVSDNPVLLPDSGSYTGPGIIYYNQRTYFDPAAVLNDSLKDEKTVTILFFAPGCESSAGVSKPIVVKSCDTDCPFDDFQVVELPSRICSDDSLYILWKPTFDSSWVNIIFYGEGILYDQDGNIYFDPTKIAFESGQTEKTVNYYIESVDCKGVVSTESRQVLVAKCCDDLVHPVLPDTLCVTDQPVKLSDAVWYQGPGIRYNNGWYFDPSQVDLSPNSYDSTFIFIYYLENACDSGTFQKVVTVFRCAPDTNDCPEVVFPDLPANVCSKDSLFFLSISSGYNFSANGEGITHDFYNQGYYFDPRNVYFPSGVTEKVVTIYYYAESCNGDTTLHSEEVIVSLCINDCDSISFPEMINVSICNTSENVLLYAPKDGIWEYSITGEGVFHNNSGYYFNPSAITMLPGESGIIAEIVFTYELCNEKPSVVRNIYVINCTPYCDSTSFPAYFPDTVCVYDELYFIAGFQDSTMSNYQIWGEGVIQGFDGYYFDPSLISNDTTTIYFSGKKCGNYVTLTKHMLVVPCDSGETVLYYPNPVNAGTKLTVKNIQVENLKLYSITGELLKTSTSSKLDTSGLESGSYLLHIVDKNGMFSTKLVQVQ